MPVTHYENFPVASWLLPARIRPPIEAIYGFARGADDIADEGEATDAQRLAGLDRYLEALDAIMGLRVSQTDEIQGLDLSQHGEEGYIFF